MSKLENLRRLRDKINLIVKGKVETKNNIFVSNHMCLLDTLYVPCALDQDVVSLTSSRLVYKQLPRQEKVETYLNAFPIEAHGGKIYSDLCLKYATDILKNGIDLNLFPEGAYIEDNTIVTRGRVGAARLLFDIRDRGIKYNIIPVSVDQKDKILDLDSFDVNDNVVEVQILNPVDYEEEYYDYLNANDSEKRELYHKVIDKCMTGIAKATNKRYTGEYIELFPKGNVIFSNGEVIDKEIAQNQEYIQRYENELKERSKRFIYELKR